jgi:hypothetical protein
MTATQIETPAPPAPSALTTGPNFPAQLVDIDGTVRFAGLVLPIAGGDRPRAVRVDGQIYVDTGGIVGSGATGPRHVYQREPAAAFVATGEIV